jgi:uncharacterized membrane protein YhaH (DUF805 family)
MSAEIIFITNFSKRKEKNMFYYARFVFVLLNMALVSVWIILAVLSLVQLRRQNLNETARAIWAALIVVVPFLGAIAFFIVKPGQESSSQVFHPSAVPPEEIPQP